MPENGHSESESPDRERDGRDRLTVVLIGAVAIALIAVLSLTGYLLYFGLRPSPARTATELKIATLIGATKSKPKDSATWAMLADAYIDAGKLDEAADTLDEAKSAVGSETGDLLFERGRLLYSRGRLGDATTMLKRAAQRADAERKAKEAEFKKKDVFQKVTSPTLVSAQVLLGDIYEQQKHHTEAIGSYTTALKEDPTMADILTARGDAYAAVNRPKDARSDYQQALSFDPNYEQARAGLEKIKAVGK